jgi:hypothetical protein
VLRFAHDVTSTARARRVRASRWLIVLVAAVVVAFAAREAILRTIGSILVAGDPITRADVVVVALDAGGAGLLEAADLVHGGVAPRVAVFADPPAPEDLEFIRRGLPYEDEGARQVRQLGLLKVDDVLTIARSDAGTSGEADVLPAWCDRNAFQSIVVVASADHSRRLRRVLARAMQGHPTRVAIRPSRYSQFDPDRWWTTRAGTRTAIIELQKLTLDVLLHPF